jgi:hypothetical protein
MTTLRELLDAPPRGFWLRDRPDLLDDLRHQPVPETDIAETQIRMRTELTNGRSGRATNWLVAGLAADGAAMLDRVIEAGTLRASVYGYEHRALATLVHSVLEEAPRLMLAQEPVRYFHSVANLLRVCDGVRTADRQLRRDVRRAGAQGIRSMLAFVDLLFARRHEPLRDGSSDEWDRFSIEELGEAFSYCYFLYLQTDAHDPRALGYPTDAEAVRRDAFGPMLAAAARIRQYREWELLLESGAYECAADVVDGSTARIGAQDPTLEKALRFGYIQTDFAVGNAAREFEGEDLIREDRVVEDLYRIFSRLGLFRLVDEPMRRVRFEFPLIPELAAIFAEKGVLRDEAAYLRYAEQQHLLDAEALMERRIAGNLTGWDVLRAWRGLRLLSRVMWRHLDGLARRDPDTLLRSLVPVFTPEVLEGLIAVFVEDEGKAREIVEHLSWDPASRKVFDLQYYPFVRAGEWIAVPMNVAGASDWLRNLMFIFQPKLRAPGRADPAEVLLWSAFDHAGIPAVQGQRYRFGEDQGDIDVLAATRDHLFLLECKTVYLPVNPFELRRTLKEMNKAVKQLERARRLAGDPEFLAYLRRSSRLDIHPAQQVISAIVLTNRMFSGASYTGQPVRGLRELGSFVASGNIIVRGVNIRLVAGDRVEGNDVAAYLCDDIVHRRVFAAMVPYDRVFRFGTKSVRLASFALDPEALDEAFGRDPATS